MPSKTPFVSRLGQTYSGHKFSILVKVCQLFAAAHFAITYLYSWGPTTGPSMLPGWEIWDRGAFVSYLHRRGRDIKVGDIVRFKIPISDGNAIKRVMGMPGDYVLVHGPDSGRNEMIQVPKGHCWVLGDNASASRDSRLYGPVPLALVDGKVLYQTGSWPWQWQKIMKIKNPLEEE